MVVSPRGPDAGTLRDMLEREAQDSEQVSVKGNAIDPSQNTVLPWRLYSPPRDAHKPWKW